MFVTPDNKILFPESLRKEVMWNFHGYAHCGHSAFWQCLKDIKNSCYSWPTLETDVKSHRLLPLLSEDRPSLQDDSPINRIPVCNEAVRQ
ncbi:hypothetical protein GEMRC1_000983 [Eukaryota sp. GEM-RC1]